MIRSALTLSASLAAGYAIKQLAYWDGWHKGVARGRELGMAEARRQLDKALVATTTSAAIDKHLTFHNQVPVGAMLPDDWLVVGDDAWLDPWPGGES